MFRAGPHTDDAYGRAQPADLHTVAGPPTLSVLWVEHLIHRIHPTTTTKKAKKKKKKKKKTILSVTRTATPTLPLKSLLSKIPNSERERRGGEMMGWDEKTHE